MKQTMRHRLILGLLLFTALFSVLPAHVLAVAGTVYFDQSNGTIISGNEFTVEVRGNVPSPTTWPFYGGGTTTIVSYDSNRLQLISYSDTGGVFQEGSKSWNTSRGSVRYQSTIAFGAPGVNDQKIISVKFKALSVGNTTLRFASGTSVNDGPTSGTPATFTIIAATCPSGQVGTPPNCTVPQPSPSPTPRPSTSPRPTTSPTPTASPLPTTTPTPQPSTTPLLTPTEEIPTPSSESDGGLKIEDVKVTTNREKNSVTWTLNKEDVPPKLFYGTSKNNLSTEAVITTQKPGEYEAILPSLTLGTLYHFMIKAATSDQLQGAVYNGTLTTRGYPVQLTIQQNGVLAPGAKVKIGERSFVANKAATITTELGEGKYEAIITTSSSSSVTFTVAKKTIPAEGEPPVQHFTLNAVIESKAATQSTTSFVAIIGGVLGALLIGSLVIGILIFRRRRAQSQVGIDGDLLAASYGTALHDYRINTPEPNLETKGASLLVATPIPQTVDQIVPVEQELVSTDNNPSVVAMPATPLDTPPPTQEISTPDTAEGPSPQTPEPHPVATFDASQQSDELSLSQPVVAVESVEATNDIEQQNLDPITSNEETAIYHAETGELDIIHRHQSVEQSQ